MTEAVVVVRQKPAPHQLIVVASVHEQTRSAYFNQLARGHPSGRDDVREIPSRRCATSRICWPSGIDIGHETELVLVEPVWPVIFRRQRSARRRVAGMRAYPFASGAGDLDEVFVKVTSASSAISWRAVDHEGEVLEAVVTARRDKAAALEASQEDHEEVRPTAEHRYRQASSLLRGNERD